MAIPMKKNYAASDIDRIESDKDINENTTKRTTWYSIRSELLNSPTFICKIRQYSMHYFLFQCYLKTMMLSDEKYYIPERGLDFVIEMYCTAYNADKNDIKAIYYDLLKEREIKILYPACFGEAIIVDDGIIENYYQAQKKRAAERKKAQLRAAREAEEKKKTQTAPTAPLPAPTAPINTDSVEQICTDDEEERTYTDEEVFGFHDMSAEDFFSEK